MGKMTENGLSTCNAIGEEKWEWFEVNYSRHPYKMLQYDYRHTNGELFSCVGRNIESCRKMRDNWIAKKEGC